MASRHNKSQVYSGSSDEGESDSSAEKDSYELDNFVVPDSELSESEEEIPNPPKKRPRTRRLKKRDAEDLELLEENLGVSARVLAKSAEDLEAKLFQGDSVEIESKEPKPTKRRKLVEDSDSDQSDMIEDDLEEGEVPEENSSFKLAATIFGTDPGVSSKKCESSTGFFEPSELKAQFVTNEDEVIRETDVAERLQHRLRHREFPTENEIDYETDWLSRRMALIKPSLTIEALKEKITYFLALHRVEKYEIPFIARYKIHLLSPEIENESDLWLLYCWEGEWGSFYAKKEKLASIITNSAKNTRKAARGKILEENAKVLSCWGEPGDIPKHVSELMLNCSPFEYMSEVQDLQHYVDVHVYNYAEAKDRRKKSTNLVVEARRNNLIEFVAKAGLTPVQISENIQANDSIHKPAKQTTKPSELAFEFLSDSYQDELKVISSACLLMKSELMSTPVFRHFVRDNYRKSARVFTYPTSKGQSVLDIFHPLYRAKHLGHGKTIESFSDELWTEILKCEREELITVEFRLPSSDTKDDRILKLLKAWYLSPIEEDESDADWNKFRFTVLKQALEELYILLEKDIRTELSAKSEEVILQKCNEAFRKLLNTPRFELENEEESVKGVMSVVADANNERFGACAVAFTDEWGDVLHTQTFKLLTAGNPQKLKGVDLETFKEEKRMLEMLILEKQPDLVVIGANSLAAVQLRRFLGGLLENLTSISFNESNVDWQIDPKDLLSSQPVISMASLEVPRLFAISHRAKHTLKDINFLQRQAVSLARFSLFPTSETLGLWSDPNENQIISLNLHPLQKEVSESRLLGSLEIVAIQHCCDRGVDINTIADHEHLKHTLTFICGLGHVKAHSLFESLRNKFKGKLSFRAQLIAKRVLTSRVYENCASFLRIPYIERESDPLDSTRIHPEHYELAKRVVSSALEIAMEDQLDDMYISQVMQDPSCMEDLDLDSYAAFLESKGKTNMKHFLEFIVKELSNPYHVPKMKYSEPSPQELMYMCCRETPESFKVGSLVQGVVIEFKEELNYMRCRLECGLEGLIDMKNISNKKEITPGEVIKLYPKGTSIKARVIDISAKLSNNKDLFFRVKMSMLPEDIRNHGKLVKLELDDSFIIDDSDWFERAVMEDESSISQKYVPRVINYPKFKNISYKTACEELQNKDIGDFIFRPSSRGLDHITCTWKFYDFVYAHLDIIEEGKPAPNMIGKKFRIATDVFDSLQEIVERYIVPCEKLTKETIVHSKFKDSLTGGISFIHSLLRQEKSAMPTTIPYFLTIVPSYPQFILLLYLPKERIIEEFIKVKPRGLFFHEAYHPSITFLLSWFKRHQSDKVYQSQLSRSKPPLIDTTNHFAIPAAVEPETPTEVPEYDSFKTPRTGRETPYRSNRTPFGDATPYAKTPHIGAQEWAGGRDLNRTPRADDWEMKTNYESFAVPATPRSERIPNRAMSNSSSNVTESDQKTPWERSSNLNKEQASWGGSSNTSWGDSLPATDWNSEPKPTERGRGRGNRVRGNDGGSRACFKCGEEGHMSRDCTKAGEAKPRGCFKCGEEGHMSRDCTKAGMARPKGCFNCGEEGHMSRECPRGGRGNRRGRGRGRGSHDSGFNADSGRETSSTGGWGNESSSTGGWGNETSSSGGWGNESSSTGGWGNESSSTGGWGNESSSSKGLGNQSSSTVGWDNESSSTGGWGNEPNPIVINSTDSLGNKSRSNTGWGTESSSTTGWKDSQASSDFSANEPKESLNTSWNTQATSKTKSEWGSEEVNSCSDGWKVNSDAQDAIPHNSSEASSSGWSGSNASKW